MSRECVKVSLSTSLCAQCTVSPNTLKYQSLEQRKVYLSAMQEGEGLRPLPKALSSKNFQQSIFKEVENKHMDTKGKREGGIYICMCLENGFSGE